jgi:hypothetical protein
MPNRRLAITLTTVATSLAVAACGSSGKSSDPPAKSAAAMRQGALAFSRCMRAHGLTNFPDPNTTGGGMRLQISPNSGISPFSPTFKAAQAACHKLLPGGGPFSGHPSAQDKAQMLQISQCMRRHGISDFPDPTTTPPSSPTGSGAVIGRNGVFLVLPKSIDEQSPAFKQAASACNFGGPQ